MRISAALRVLSVAALAAVTACSGDLPSAPAAPSLDLPAPSLARVGTPNAGSVARITTIRVNTAKSEFHNIGGQSWVYIPAGALCNDAAGYGPELWETACTPATGTVSIEVSLSTVKGRPAAEFHKDVRFVPTNSGYWRDWVILGLKVQGDLNQQLGYGILYRPTGSAQWIDESATDPSLKAWRTFGNVVARRLKHFSGYNVSLGFEETSDPTVTVSIE